MVSVFLVSVLELVAAVPAGAQTAGMLSFQGLLKNAGGVPVNGPVTLQFRIYDAQTGGALVDMDRNGVVEDIVGKDAKQVSATAAKGIVSTKFGPVPPKAFDGSARWLEVRVNGTALSRTEMAGAPAAAEQVNKPGTGTEAIRVDADGRVGIGTALPQALLHLSGVPGTDGIMFPDGSVQRTAAGGGGGFWASSGTNIYNVNTGNIGIGTTNPQYGRLQIFSSTLDAAGGVSWYQGSGTTARAYLKPDGTGDYNWHLTRAGNDARGIVVQPNGNVAVPGRLAWDTSEPSADAYSIAAIGPGILDIHGCNVSIKTGPAGQQTEALYPHGGYQVAYFRQTVSMPVAVITGGSDLAEPFVVGSDEATNRRSDGGVTQASDGAGGGAAVNSQRDTRNSQLPSPQPGMVVVIDPANPGRLNLATEAYDRKVAGVISGANGLKPGMVMGGLGNDERETINDERSGGRSASDGATERRREGGNPHPVPLP